MVVDYKKKRRKRSKKLIEEHRRKEGQAILFMSPLKIQEVRDLNTRREQAKVDEQASKQLAKDERKSTKIAKQEEAERKRQERAKQ